jgi:putative two-component system response regulator
MNSDNGIKLEDIHQARVLIVDDQPPNVLLLTRLLETDGYRNVTGTSDPTQVRAMHQEDPFDLILLDIRMPKLDGFGVMQQLHEDTSDDYVPILVLTAQNDDATRLRALEEGAKDFVTKPFNQFEVKNRIRNMLEVRLLHNRVRNQNQILEQKVQERTRQIHDTRLEIIRRLGRAAEYRDNETGLHIIRMSTYSAQLARAMGLKPAHVELILNASPMHDIGKLGIPDSILLKPGRLDASEMSVMQTHSQIGADILAGHESTLMRSASRIALCHHEKWDGSGYPRGISGTDIPLEARIAAVADVFDALTSKRPYKEAWEEERAVAHMEKCSGSHFDPGVIEVFMKILPDIRATRERYAEPD